MSGRGRIANCIGALLMLALGVSVALAEPISPDTIRVIDGDTIRVDRQRPDYRLVGFNTPETRDPECEAERALGVPFLCGETSCPKTPRPWCS